MAHHHEHGCCSEHEEHCHCGGHCHSHEHGGIKHRVILIILTIFLLSIAVFVEKQFQLSIWQLLLIYLVPYLLIGHETLHEAIEGMKEKDHFISHDFTEMLNRLNYLKDVWGNVGGNIGSYGNRVLT